MDSMRGNSSTLGDSLSCISTMFSFMTESGIGVEFGCRFDADALGVLELAIFHGSTEKVLVCTAPRCVRTGVWYCVAVGAQQQP